MPPIQIFWDMKRPLQMPAIEAPHSCGPPRKGAMVRLDRLSFGPAAQSWVELSVVIIALHHLGLSIVGRIIKVELSEERRLHL